MGNCGSSSLIAVIPVYRNSIVIMQRFQQHPFGRGKAVGHCTGQGNESHCFLGSSLPPAPFSVVGGGEKQYTMLHLGFGQRLKAMLNP